MPEILCPWEASSYLFFSSNVPALIHYSHAVAVLSALPIGLFIFYKNPRSIISRLIVLFVTLFTVWAALDVILWATNRPDVVMFSWALQVLLEPLTYVVAFYLFYLFLYKKFPSFGANLLVFFLLLPLVLFLSTNLNLEGLLLSTCESMEGPLAMYYTYAVHLIMMLSIVHIGAKAIPTLPTRQERIAAFCFGLGLVTFLLSFTSGNIIGSFTDDWTISQYGLFGMPIFAGLIAYSIVKFKAFNAKAIGAEILVFVLGISIISIATLQEITYVRTVATFTFVLVCFIGYVLVRSVKKEVAQREEIEKLAQNLENANVRLKELDKMKSEFVSIASHQLRSPLTSIRGYVSMLTEGSYGVLPEKASEVLAKIAESSKFMALSIEDYLNVSRIEAGNMKYEYSVFNLKEVAQAVVEELRPIVEKRGLSLTYESKISGNSSVRADIGKTRQVIANLLDNSIKYTPKGTITVTATNDLQAKKVSVVIKDTGVGMSNETLEAVFNKFVRAKNANSVNVTGTGLGLYVAKTMITQMGGRIWAESEGEGKGSVFTIELPLSS